MTAPVAKLTSWQMKIPLSMTTIFGLKVAQTAAAMVLHKINPCKKSGGSRKKLRMPKSRYPQLDRDGGYP